MKVDYASDFHTNHHVPFVQNQEKWQQRTKDWAHDLFKDKTGDVLVMAGDFSEWNTQSFWVMEVASLLYDHVFVGAGNHDYYLLSKSQRKKYKTSFGRVEELFALASTLPNVTPLHQTVVTYNGVTFAGDPMWYKVATERDRMFYTTQSNDSVFVHTGVPYEEPHDVLHDLSMDWYLTLEEQHVDVFVSHMPPVHPPHSPFEPNGCYMTPVPFYKGKHWVCGHQHVQGSFEKAGVQFHMNPLGYPSEGLVKKVSQFVV